MTDEEARLAKAYLSFKQSDVGQIIIADLRNKFFERTFVSEDSITSTNDFLLQIGMREVIIYILQQTELLEYEQQLQKVRLGNGRDTTN